MYVGTYYSILCEIAFAVRNFCGYVLVIQFSTRLEAIRGGEKGLNPCSIKSTRFGKSRTATSFENGRALCCDYAGGFRFQKWLS